MSTTTTAPHRARTPADVIVVLSSLAGEPSQLLALAFADRESLQNNIHLRVGLLKMLACCQYPNEFPENLMLLYPSEDVDATKFLLLSDQGRDDMADSMEQSFEDAVVVQQRYTPTEARRESCLGSISDEELRHLTERSAEAFAHLYAEAATPRGSTNNSALTRNGKTGGLIPGPDQQADCSANVELVSCPLLLDHESTTTSSPDGGGGQDGSDHLQAGKVVLVDATNDHHEQDEGSRRGVEGHFFFLELQVVLKRFFSFEVFGKRRRYKLDIQCNGATVVELFEPLDRSLPLSVLYKGYRYSLRKEPGVQYRTGSADHDDQSPQDASSFSPGAQTTNNTSDDGRTATDSAGGGQPLRVEVRVTGENELCLVAYTLQNASEWQVRSKKATSEHEKIWTREALTMKFSRNGEKVDGSFQRTAEGPLALEGKLLSMEDC